MKQRKNKQIIIFMLLLITSYNCLSELSCNLFLDTNLYSQNPKDSVIICIALTGEKPQLPYIASPPVNVCIVIDTSKSMQGEKIKKSQDAAIQLLNKLRKQDILSIITYNTQVQVLIPAQHVSNKKHIAEHISNIQCTGETALYGGLCKGVNELRKNLHKNYISRILLISDGKATIGPTTKQELSRFSIGLQKEGISITTIGIGSDCAEDIMTQIAQMSDSNTYYAKNIQDIPQIFNNELSEMFNIVAQHIKVELQLPSYLIAQKIINNVGTIHKNNIKININQISKSQIKYIFVQAQLLSKAKSINPITAKCQYYDTSTQKVAVCQATTKEKKAKRKNSIAKTNLFQEQYLEQLSVQTQNRVITLYKTGENIDAVYKLYYLGLQIKEMGKNSNNINLLKESEELLMRANLLDNTTLTNNSRKAWMTNNTQRMRQQTTQQKFIIKNKTAKQDGKTNKKIHKK